MGASRAGTRRSGWLLPFLVTAALAGMGLAYAGTSGAGVPAQAADICDESGDGWQPKVDTTGDPEFVDVSAPTGYLITAYCSKGGQDKEIVTVDPPQETVTIGGENLSHYQIKLCWLGPNGGNPTNTLDAPLCPEEPPPPNGPPPNGPPPNGPPPPGPEAAPPPPPGPAAAPGPAPTAPAPAVAVIAVVRVTG